MEIKETKKLKKKLDRFVCDTCDFKCYMKCDWDRHIIRPKHVNFQKQQCEETKKLKKTYICDCGKNFVTNSGLWKHKKICDNLTDLNEEKLTDKELIMMLVKQNSDLMEVIKNGTHNTNSHNTNSHNKTFNLQFFLNETCKHAININEFVDSIKVQIKDLEKVGEIGYAEGISNIFISNLQQLDSHTRPIHCSDSKRETLYIKDEEQWSKDDENKSALTKAIKNVANKNIKKINEWQKIHPEYSNPKSKQNDKYMKIVLNSMSGSSQEESNKNYEKIIKNVIKETIIVK
jgi:hypothetical protein